MFSAGQNGRIPFPVGSPVWAFSFLTVLSKRDPHNPISEQGITGTFRNPPQRHDLQELKCWLHADHKLSWFNVISIRISPSSDSNRLCIIDYLNHGFYRSKLLPHMRQADGSAIPLTTSRRSAAFDTDHTAIDPDTKRDPHVHGNV